MNKQHIYDTVAAHLLKQNEKSVVCNEADPEDNQCLYAGPRGLRCAIGCLLPKGMDTSEFEGDSVGGLIAYEEVADHLYDVYGINLNEDADGDFLDTLQALHDNTAPIEWARSLAQFAKDNNLNA